MITAGRLKSRIVIERPVETADGAGGATIEYETQTVVWASVHHRASRARYDSDVTSALNQVRVLIRSGISLSIHHRLRDGETVYLIRALRLIDDGGFIEIEAETNLFSV